MVMVGMAPFLVPAVEDYLGVEDAEEFLVAVGGSVAGGSNAWGPSTEPSHPYAFIPRSRRL